MQGVCWTAWRAAEQLAPVASGALVIVRALHALLAGADRRQFRAGRACDAAMVGVIARIAATLRAAPLS